MGYGFRSRSSRGVVGIGVLEEMSRAEKLGGG